MAEEEPLDTAVSNGAPNDPPAAASSPGCAARILIQQCTGADLQVQPAAGDTPAEHVQIGRGVVIYVCFLKGATSETVKKMVKDVLSVRLSESPSGKLVSVLDLPGDILIVPQATLGGRTKQSAMQYHQNIDKSTGLRLYDELAAAVAEEMKRSRVSSEKGCRMERGTYGNRQVLKMETNGPYSHLMEF